MILQAFWVFFKVNVFRRGRSPRTQKGDPNCPLSEQTIDGKTKTKTASWIYLWVDQLAQESNRQSTSLHTKEPLCSQDENSAWTDQELFPFHCLLRRKLELTTAFWVLNSAKQRSTRFLNFSLFLWSLFSFYHVTYKVIFMYNLSLSKKKKKVTHAIFSAYGMHLSQYTTG